jgi:hypothetical protein
MRPLLLLLLLLLALLLLCRCCYGAGFPLAFCIKRCPRLALCQGCSSGGAGLVEAVGVHYLEQLVCAC